MNDMSPRIMQAQNVISDVAEAIRAAACLDPETSSASPPSLDYYAMAAAAIRKLAAQEPSPDPCTSATTREIFVQWSNDKQHIRRWSFSPSDLAERLLVEAVTQGEAAC